MKGNGTKNNSELDPQDDYSSERKTYITADFEMQLFFSHFASVAGSFYSLFNYMTKSNECSRNFLTDSISFKAHCISGSLQRFETATDRLAN